MIRINLLGQIRPKAARRPVDTGAAMPLVFIGAGVLLGGLFLFYFYHSWQTQLDQENKRIKTLQAQKTELEQIKQRAENLWLTSMTKRGNALTLEGAAASINSVANFITALKRSGYFQKIEIKDAKQDDQHLNVQTFLFTINAEIAPNGPEATGAPQAKPANAPATGAPANPAPAKKG